MKAISAFIIKWLQYLKQNWRIITSVLFSLILLVLAIINHQQLIEAFKIVYAANMGWIAAALGVILISYLITSQVLLVALRFLGYRMGIFRLWAIGLVAIVFSQSVPGGGLGSYAFLLGMFRRRGIPAGHATLVASLEAISYVSAMLIMFIFSLIYLTIHGLGAGPASYLAAGAALLIIGIVIFVLTRDKAWIAGVLLTAKRALARLLRREWSDIWVLRKVGELAHGRSMLAGQYRELALLIFIQLVGLMGHSLAMLMILWSLGIEASFFVVVAAFGIALITSTFNVLPGGGGTVEAAISAVLAQVLGIGFIALPAAIIFRLLNFWLIMPVAAACYYWLTGGKSLKRQSRFHKGRPGVDAQKKVSTPKFSPNTE